ncbi:roadblock/LC7 domain-containing protein [Nocardia asiatica]|uniref:roadblock/LC7 domain-containing protein n=1 Tax=Nocardia asiatica TaxID=209252 RepID=UPI003EDF00CD
MTAKTRNRDWLLDDLIERLPNADFAVVLSTDGLLLGRCSAMAQSDAERFAAIGSTLHAVARGDGTHFDVGGYTRPLWTGSGDVVHRRWRQHLFGPADR